MIIFWLHETNLWTNLWTLWWSMTWYPRLTYATMSEATPENHLIILCEFLVGNEAHTMSSSIQVRVNCSHASVSCTTDANYGYWKKLLMKIAGFSWLTIVHVADTASCECLLESHWFRKFWWPSRSWNKHQQHNFMRNYKEGRWWTSWRRATEVWKSISH